MTDERPEGAAETLGKADKEQVERRARASAAVIHETVRSEGQDELRRPVSSLFWSGIAAGLSMGFSLATEGLLRASLPDAPWTHLIASLGYTTGFLFVILGRQQLFTENTLTVVLPVLHDPSARVLGLMLRLWAVVLVANILGTLAFAAAAAHTDIFGQEARSAFVEIGTDAAAARAIPTLLKAIVAGWLIALMVWLLPEAGSAGIIVIAIITYIVGVGELSHVIAGSTEVLFAVLSGAVGWTDYVLTFFLPTLAGNIFGGVTLVALLNHAQVKSEL